MSKYLVEDTYATALYTLAQQTGEAEAVLSEIALVSDTLRSNKKYFMLLRNPRIGKPEKKELVRELFQDSICQTLMNFIMLVFDKRRIQFLPGIAKRYREMVNEGNNKAEGLVVTAIALNQEELIKIEEKVSKLLRKEVLLKNKVEPQIIGGMKIFVEDQEIDASVGNRLKVLRNSFKEMVL